VASKHAIIGLTRSAALEAGLLTGQTIFLDGGMTAA